MVLLKLVFLLLLIYVPVERLIVNDVYSCSGPDIRATGIYAEKIKSARSLFTKQIDFPEPKYFIRKTECYNGLSRYNVRTRNTEVIFTKALIDNFSTEELAGTLAHELGHLQKLNQDQGKAEEWEIDVIGAELTSQEILISCLTRLSAEIKNIRNKHPMVMRIFPRSLRINETAIKEFEQRINKVREFTK